MDDHQSRTPKMPRGKWYRIVLVISVLAAVALFSVGAISHSSVAHAGNNGQQVGLNLCPPLQAAQVSGTNQDGNQVTWTAWGHGATSIVTTGWWWVGYIDIIYTTEDGTHYYQRAWVPQQMDGDIDWIPCDGNPMP